MGNEQGKNVGQTLQALRSATGESQKSIALKAGASRDSLSSWETGRRNPGPQYFGPLMRALNVPEDQWQELAIELGYKDYPLGTSISDADEMIRRTRAHLNRISSVHQSLGREIESLQLELNQTIFVSQEATNDNNAVDESFRVESV